MFELCAMANKLPSDINITCAARMVLSILCDCADKSLQCFPGNETLAKRAGVSCRTVIRSVAKLERLGLVSVRRQRNRSNRYTINRGVLYSILNQDVTPCHLGGDTLSISGDTVAPEPVRESIKESISLLKINLEGTKTGRLSYTNVNRSNYMSLDDLQKAVNNKEPIPGLKQKVKISISAHWCRVLNLWREEHGMESTTLLISQVGTHQLNGFKKKCTDENPFKVMRKCVLDWYGFTNYVMKVTGGSNKPTAPQVAYLLINVQHAQDFYSVKVYDTAGSNTATLTKKVVEPVKGNSTLDILKEIEDDEG